jgi:catechol 2,3-dioxygenase-like lactoylglutathione lyase family enzyme
VAPVLETRKVGLRPEEVSPLAQLPLRLHHHAYVVKDQERTRRFYEGVLGIPLAAMWIECEETDGQSMQFSHSFYEIGDGGALAFFCFADEEQGRRYAAKPQLSFVHVAFAVSAETQEEIKKRLVAHDIQPWVVEHGYCRSLYVTDPDALNLEFTVDPPIVDKIRGWQRETSRESLRRWQEKDYTPNNRWRHEEHG